MSQGAEKKGLTWDVVLAEFRSVTHLLGGLQQLSSQSLALSFHNTRGLDETV